MRQLKVALLVVASLVVGAPGAAAAPPWSPVASLVAGEQRLEPVATRGFADGSALVAWTRVLGARCTTDSEFGVARRTRDGRLGAPVLRRGRPLGPAVALPGGRTAVVLLVAVTSRRRCAARPRLLVLSAEGRTHDTIALPQEAGQPQLDPRPGGALGVVYTTYEHVGGSSSRAGAVQRIRELVVRSGRLGHPRTLDVVGSIDHLDGGIGDVRLAGAPGGVRLLVASASNGCPGRTRARTCGRLSTPLSNEVRVALAPAGRGFGSFRRVANTNGFIRIAAAVTARGRPVVAWGSQDDGEEADRPWRIEATSTDPRGRWRKPTLLDAGDRADRPAGGLTLSAAPDGTTTVAWSGVRSRSDPIRVARSRVDGSFPAKAGRRLTELALSGVVAGSVIAADGTTTLLISADGSTESAARELLAVRRSPSAASFGPIEQVTDEPAQDPQLTLNAATQAPEVLWSGPGLRYASRP